MPNNENNISTIDRLIESKKREIRSNRTLIGLNTLTATLNLALVGINSSKPVVCVLWAACCGLQCINIGIRSTALSENKDELCKLNLKRMEYEEEDSLVPNKARSLKRKY